MTPSSFGARGSPGTDTAGPATPAGSRRAGRKPGTRRSGGPAAGLAPRPGEPSLWPLAALAAVVTLLTLTGVLPRWPGVVHAVALPPLDLFTDLRILLARAPSYPVFLLGLTLALTVRITVLAALIPGPWRRRLRFAALYHLLVLPPLLLAAQLDFMAQALLYARLFWGAIGFLAVVWLVAAPVPWQSAPDAPGLRTAVARSRRRALRVEVLLPYVVVLLGIGVLADRWPGLIPLLVPVSAAATAGAILLLRRPPGGRPPLRGAVAALVLAVLAGAFVGTRTEADPGPRPEPRSGSILLMSGINSGSGQGAIFETEVERLGYDCDTTFYFSYAGPGDGQPRGAAHCPIVTGAPYVPEDTQRPVAEQVDVFVEQVRELPRPLVVAAHSHAVWIAWRAIAEGRAPQVDALVLVGPFPESPVGYPPAGEDATGRVAGDLLRSLMPVADLMDFRFDADAPAALELLATPDAASDILAQPLPDDVRVLSVTSATDLPLMPNGWRLAGENVEADVCPLRVPHPYLPIRPAFTREVNRFLDGEPPTACPPWRDWGIPLSRPFGTPPHDA
ncbi:hypothetical protein [Streptomyces sp. ST2-7A]|uniref:hypothetical protein n=1 Tax=Streptomyces sp. ST2-7A TaxID=2907214 RepID=UPI001F452D11|nr:hypothetical protein [Streptomyces sp. ST2-7A]MCE7083426.1 hypothetical protein [Streptomyces sp. ST2-7A]